MRTQPIPLVGGSYADETRPWSMQDTVNFLPCAAEKSGTRSQGMLKTPPGLYPYLEMPSTGGGEFPVIPAPPVRGTHNAEGKFFAAIGPMLYQVSNAGVAIPVGALPGLGRVDFTHNQISLGNEVVAVNGSAGYVYNTVTGAYGRITDPGFPGSYVARFIDGYVLGIDPQGRFAFNSLPAQATQYNTLDRFTSEVRPDKLVSLAVSNNELMLLSSESCEFFQNEGRAQQPFRSKRISLDKGCAGPYAVVEIDNSVCWLGSDGAFYRLEGYTPRRISTRPIEQAIRGLNWQQAFAFLWEDSGHTVAYWTFPDGRTWGWDAASGEWHRRESFGMHRWRVNTMTRWRDEWYAGDFQRGRIWRLDWSYALEYDQEFISERTLPVIHDDQNLVLIPRLEIVMDTGQQETVPAEFPVQPTGPSITGSAPDGAISTAYAGFQYTVTAGDAAVTGVAVRSGGMPPGLMIDSSALIDTGTPTTMGSYPVKLRVTDANGLYGEHDDVIDIGTMWFAVSSEENAGVRSAGGRDWSGATELDLAGKGIFSGGGKIVLLFNSDGGKVSDDVGVTWTPLTGDATGTSTGGCYAGAGVYLLTTTTESIRRSTDGIDYDSVDLPANLAANTVASNGALTIVGSVDSLGGNSAVSADRGATWDGPYAALGADAGSKDVLGIATDGTKFIAVGQSASGTKPRMYSTTNGTAWTAITSPFTGSVAVTQIIWGNGIWIAMASDGQIAKSADGVTFTKQATGFGEVPACIDYANGLFVAVGQDARIGYTTDGTTWVFPTNNFGATSAIDAVAAYKP